MRTSRNFSTGRPRDEGTRFRREHLRLASFSGMHGKPKISGTVGAQPYSRCLAVASFHYRTRSRQPCNMNMQFYDHSGETHVRTRASYAFRPRRTFPGLFGRKVTNIRRRERGEGRGGGGGERARSTPVCCVCTLCTQFHAARGKFRNSFLGKW